MEDRAKPKMPEDVPSGFRQLLGFRITEWREGDATLTLTIGPRHLNRSGVLHGGVIATLIDAAGGYAGCYCPHPNRVRRSVTVSMTTHFLAQAKIGTLTTHARVRGGGRRLFIASVEVHDNSGALVAIGEGVYRYRAGSETLEGVPLERGPEKRDTPLG